MRTGVDMRTPGVITNALRFVVDQCADKKDGLLGAEEILPVWEFQDELASGLSFLPDAWSEGEILVSILLDLGVLTLASERVDNYDVQVHPGRAQEILGIIANIIAE